MHLTKLAPALAMMGALFFVSAGRADAAPTFLLPDTTFSSTNTSSFTNTSMTPYSYTLNVSTAAGASMATDFGTGYNTTTGSITVAGGTVTVTTAEGNYSGTLEHSYSLKSLVGVDVVSTLKVTSSSLTGVNVGGQAILDLHVFNYTNGSGAVKGDIAPVVPEPASLSLLLLGTLGAVGAVRRRSL